MQTTTHQSDEMVSLSFSGRLTVDRLDERLPRIARRLADRGVRTLVLDLAAVTYMDSTCLGELVEAAAVLRQGGGRLVLTRVPARVQRLLDLSRLGDVLRASGRQTVVAERWTGPVAVHSRRYGSRGGAVSG